MSRGSKVHRMWSFLVRRQTLAAMLVTAGVLCLLAPRSGLPAVVTSDWWVRALFVPESVRAVAAILAGVGVLLIALLWQSGERKRLSQRGLLGAGSMVVGLLVVVFYWFTLHQSLPAGQFSLGVNETAEFYEVPSRQAAKLRVMLPMRTTLRSIQTSDVPVARIRLAKPGDEVGATYPLTPGQVLDVDNVRIAFVGLGAGADTLRAVVTSKKAGDVPAAGGAVGDVLRFAEGGPTYEVLDVTANYFDTLGPAVQLRSEALGEFWVFQKSGQGDAREPDYGHDLRLMEVQAMPRAVLSVVRPRPVWPVGVGAVLFLVGWGIFRRFRDSEGEIEQASVEISEDADNADNKEAK